MLCKIDRRVRAGVSDLGVLLFVCNITLAAACLSKQASGLPETGLTSVFMGAVLEIFAGFIVIGLLSGVVTSLFVGLTSRRTRR